MNKALVVVNCNYKNKNVMENVNFVLNEVRTNIKNDIYYTAVDIPRICYFLQKVGAKELVMDLPQYEEIEVIGDVAYAMKISSLYPESRVIAYL